MTLAAAPPDALLRHIERLSCEERDVLRLKAMFAWPSNKTDFQAMANRGQLSGPGGLAWSHKTLNVVLERLVALKLLNADFSCVVALWHPLTVEFLATPTGRSAAAAMADLPLPNENRSYYGYNLQLDPAFLRLLRLRIYDDHADAFAPLMAKYDKAFQPASNPHFFATLFAETPVTLDWLTSRSLGIQLRLSKVKLDRLLLTGQATPEVASMIAHYREKESDPLYRPFALHMLSCDLLSAVSTSRGAR